MKEGWFGPKKNQKLSHGGSVLASEGWVGLYFGRGNLIRLGYTGIEMVRGQLGEK